MARRRTSVLAVAGALTLVAGGVAGGFLLHSPDERVTHQIPDALVTATVDSRVLNDQITGTGQFQAAGTVPVVVQAPTGMSGVVTAVPRTVGETVSWCAQVVEVSGRPVFVLRGDVPAYRDLTEGDSGADVRQLQAALRECGYPLAVDGVFGNGTATALRKLYSDSGHRAVTDPASALTAGSPAAGTESSASAAALGTATVVTLAAPFGPALTSSSPTPTPTAPASQEPQVPAPSVVAPRGELVFTPVPPRITSIATVGSYIDSGEVVTFALQGDVFVLALTPEQASAVEAGQELSVARDGWAVTVGLPELPQAPVFDDAGTPTYPLRVELPESPPPGSYDEQGQFTITTGTDEVYPTVVPVSAIYEDTDGLRYVLVPTTTGAGGDPTTPTSERARRVDVEVLRSVQGYVAIDPLEGELVAGDEVVVGER